MGIFDFAKEGASKELAEKLTKLITSKVAVDNLNLEVKEGNVAVDGTVESEELKAQVLKLINDTEGVSGVTDNLNVLPKVEGSEVTEDGKTMYTVVSGDTLWGISEKFYGDGSKYMKIFEANKEVWKNYNDDPNVIYPDWKLVIPPAE